MVQRFTTGDDVEPRSKTGVSLQAADVAKGSEPDFLQDVGCVMFVVDQPTEEVKQAIVPSGDKLVPRCQVVATAAEN